MDLNFPKNIFINNGSSAIGHVVISPLEMWDFQLKKFKLGYQAKINLKLMDLLIKNILGGICQIKNFIFFFSKIKDDFSKTTACVYVVGLLKNDNILHCCDNISASILEGLSYLLLFKIIENVIASEAP